jgi:hypothetical protein
MRAPAELERFTRDMLYFDEHRPELLRRHPERWIAVYDQRVVGVARDPEALIRQLERQGIPPGQAFRQYLTERDELLIL